MRRIEYLALRQCMFYYSYRGRIRKSFGTLHFRKSQHLHFNISAKSTFIKITYFNKFFLPANEGFREISDWKFNLFSPAWVTRWLVQDPEFGSLGSVWPIHLPPAVITQPDQSRLQKSRPHQKWLNTELQLGEAPAYFFWMLPKQWFNSSLAHCRTMLLWYLGCEIWHTLGTSYMGV